ncbi:MAG TPA: alpha-hydroxy acid oxidase [Steroidobacteraceae bacterium]|jgi:L-lactate dehydrogenase (cytochrome)|nr:alpha-hydroxy acid oxidase [Steroidobacteraceae bacterium]
MIVVNSIADLRALAQRRLPRALFDYIERGSYDELTWARNRDDFRAISLRQRVLVDVSQLDTTVTVLGEPWKMPLCPAPTGLTGLFWRDGEIQAARAAHRAGVPFCLSTMSICSIEDVRSGFEGTLWFQLYVMRDRAFNEMLIARALEARCAALVVTLDLPLQALRRRDPKNGLAVPPRLTFASARDFARRPGWVFGVLRSRRRTFGNLSTFFPRKGTAELSEWMGSQLGPLTARDLAWVRERWPGKLIFKGITEPADARQAADIGADAIVVSNHGGRQLDGSHSTISALPRVVEAVAGRCEVLLDGGIGCGQDVLKALALGANACLVGRSYLYGLSARGESGVILALDIMRREFEISMALTGVSSARQLGRHVLS